MIHRRMPCASSIDEYASTLRVGDRATAGNGKCRHVDGLLRPTDSATSSEFVSSQHAGDAALDAFRELDSRRLRGTDTGADPARAIHGKHCAHFLRGCDRGASFVYGERIHRVSRVRAGRIWPNVAGSIRIRSTTERDAGH